MMLPKGLFHPFALPLVSFVHRATSAPTNRILINHEDLKHNPIFNAGHDQTISEWFSAQGRILEIANNATKECLSRFTVEEDNSVCYGDDKWEWNAVAVICVTSVLAGVIIAVWLCCDWAQTGIIWYLDGARREGEWSSDVEALSKDQVAEENQANLKEQDRRVDSVHAQDTDYRTQANGSEAETRVDSVHSQTAGDDLLASNRAQSNSPGFQESDSSLRNLSWLGP